jgi:hypothetical protein
MLQVIHGDEKLLHKYPGHTLLLVYPGPDEMAFSALMEYTGDVLLYVGEPCHRYSMEQMQLSAVLCA